MERTNSHEPPRHHLSVMNENVGRLRRRSIEVDMVDMLIKEQSKNLPDIFQGRDQRRKSVVERMVNQQTEYSDKLTGRARTRRASLSQAMPVKYAACRAEAVSDTVEAARKLINGLYKRRLSNESDKYEGSECSLVSRTKRLDIYTDGGLSNISRQNSRRHSVAVTSLTRERSISNTRDFYSRPSDTIVPIIKLSSPIDDIPSHGYRDRSHSPQDGSSMKSYEHRSTGSRHLSPTYTSKKSKSVQDLYTDRNPPVCASADDSQRSRSLSPSYIKTYEIQPGAFIPDPYSNNIGKHVPKNSLKGDQNPPPKPIEKCNRPTEKKSSNTKLVGNTNAEPIQASRKPNSNEHAFGSKRTADRIKHRNAHTEKLKKLLKELEDDMPMQAKLKLVEIRRELSKADEDDVI